MNARRIRLGGGLWPGRGGVRGVTLIELLCVMVIISILVSLMMPSMMKAYRRAKAFGEEADSDEVFRMIRVSAVTYCTRTTNFQFATKAEFADKCNLGPKPRDWIGDSRTQFVPFGYKDITNKTVVTFHYGNQNRESFAYTKGDLSIRPESW
jgi:prepilin-type N-terminal cleavage/methylation domain-containing protein